MSSTHSGNMLNSIVYEEHDGILNAKKVSLISAATIYTSTTFLGNVTLNPSPNYIGLVTVDIGTNNSVGIKGNVTLSDSKGFIGLVTVGNTPNVSVIGNVTISDSKGYIGLVTATANQGTSPWVTSVSGNVTISDSKGFIGLVTNMNAVSWPDPKTYIGLVTVGNTVSTTLSGNVTLDAGSKTGIVGNVTLSDSKGFIGLVTVGNTPNVSVIGNVTISDSKGYIGLVTATLARTPIVGVGDTTALFASTATGSMLNTAIMERSTGRILNLPIEGDTFADSKTGFIALGRTSGSGAGTSAKVFQVDANGNILANATISGISDPKGYIGLVTINTSLTTSLATIYSASGLATLVIPPSTKKIFVKNIHVASLGRSEVSMWRVNSTATAIVIPWTGLATTGGFVHNYGEPGKQWGLGDDGLTVALNGAATIGVMIDCGFV